MQQKTERIRTNREGSLDSPPRRKALLERYGSSGAARQGQKVHQRVAPDIDMETFTPVDGLDRLLLGDKMENNYKKENRFIYDWDGKWAGESDFEEQDSDMFGQTLNPQVTQTLNPQGEAQAQQEKGMPMPPPPPAPPVPPIALSLPSLLTQPGAPFAMHHTDQNQPHQESFEDVVTGDHIHQGPFNPYNPYKNNEAYEAFERKRQQLEYDRSRHTTSTASDPSTNSYRYVYGDKLIERDAPVPVYEQLKVLKPSTSTPLLTGQRVRRKAPSRKKRAITASRSTKDLARYRRIELARGINSSAFNRFAIEVDPSLTKQLDRLYNNKSIPLGGAVGPDSVGSVAFHFNRKQTKFSKKLLPQPNAHLARQLAMF